MSNPSEILRKVEYRVKPITRYVVTRYEEGHDESIEVGSKSWAGPSTKGQYENADVAFEVAYALCRAEHEQLGWPVADERIQYPRHPKEESASPIGG